MKICPYCAEEIQSAAKKCKHCGEWLKEETLDAKTPPVSKCLPDSGSPSSSGSENIADSNTASEQRHHRPLGTSSGRLDLHAVRCPYCSEYVAALPHPSDQGVLQCPECGYSGIDFYSNKGKDAKQSRQIVPGDDDIRISESLRQTDRVPRTAFCPVCRRHVGVIENPEGSGIRHCPQCGYSGSGFKDSESEAAATYGALTIVKPDNDSEGSDLTPLVEVAGSRPHRWRRFFARLIDYNTSGLALISGVAFCIGYFIPSKAGEFVEALQNPIAGNMFVTVIWIPVEAFLISSFGATPGKWLFGISVQKGIGKRINFFDSIERAFTVWYMGMALGIPYVATCAALVAGAHLEKEGSTAWDRKIGAVTLHKSWGVARAISCTATVLATLLFLAYLKGAA